ncbi:hypothetical protein TRVA0_016S02344 [Trichomonascus vanleenenianus]|uniref:protein kinase IKS1 n=1 Tax=Trichomonascus vanleenenianus TaxID=2268995 RepID=UPI003ECB6C97
MSLVPFGDRNANWSVVLRDNLNHSVVLYDRSSNRLSLVNDPVVIDKIDSYNTLERFSRPHVCSECGQVVNFSAMRPEIVRDQNYFKLLEATSARQESNVSQEASDSSTYSSISESAFSQGYFDRFFQSKSVLGKGSRGHVYLVEHILDGVSLGNFALKKIPVGDDHQWLEKVLGEVHLLRLLSHPNLVSYNHVWLENAKMSAFSPSVPCAFILQEYCDGGTLEDYVLARVGSVDSTNTASLKRAFRRRRSHAAAAAANDTPHLLSLNEIRHFMRDITEGVLHLHRNQIIHRDLKPSNCLLSTSPTGGLPTVLVSDFGEGQLEGSARVGTGSTGTLEYCAPELIQQLAQFSRKTDIFSLGMIMYYLCFSSLPYNDNIFEERQDIEALKQDVCSYAGFVGGQSPRADLPSEFLEILTHCLSINPAERLTAEQILTLLGSGLEEQPAREPSLSPVDVNIVEEEQLMTEETNDTFAQRPRLLLPPVKPDSEDIIVRGEYIMIKIWRHINRHFWLVKAISIIPQAMSLMHSPKSPADAVRYLLVGMELNSSRPTQFIWIYGAFWAVSLIWN